jgi:hypothetical protein
MATNTITGTFTDTAGVSGSFSVTVVLNAPLTVSAVVVPMVSDAPTTRTLTVTPAGGAPPYTFGTPVATGITFIPVSGKPGQWTFVY